MAVYLDIEQWNRKEHFHFFKQMDLPFFGLVANVDCTLAFEICKQHNHSFFIYYLHKCLTAVNQIENLKYRLEGDRIRVEEKINVSPTVGRKDNTFGFSFMEYDPDFAVFQDRAAKEIASIQSQQGLCLRPDTGREDVIHFSAIPWVHFTHLSHAGMVQNPGSVPKISIGKVEVAGDRSLMPVSIHLHHALADGYHAGVFFQLFEELLNS